MLHFLAPLTLIALAQLRLARADYSTLFVGCVSYSFSPSTSTSTFSTLDAQDCASYCYGDSQGPWTYAYFNPEAPIRKRGPAPTMCICSMEAPAAAEYATSSDTTGSATCDTNQLTMLTSASTYTFEGCYETAKLDNPSTAKLGTYADPQGCLASCKAYEVAAWYPLSGGLSCACASSSSFERGTLGGCGPTRPYFATHAVGDSINSQFAKRQLRERLVKERSERTALCPKAMTACRVPGAFIDSFECINTAEELESCGGCAQGFFNDNDAANASIGVDCTSVPGVARGGVSCTSGTCEVFACRPGWVLLAGACVPS
ncbi:hypothetical protein I316_04077 [Kwoniella heveanensis BCC8398]|uniref:Protein CPL1-like domain-containing protein n=1 Tax=Kwoniella heveanensis BCC8398 TaxID=1296120 RepID=A0A1B9GT35_9TREE|nr:hypothetical protein I316_04077 [Kwoniella heveanensis BCC8398]